MLTVVQIAEIAHETNRAYQKALGESLSPPWDDETEETRQSVMHGVRAAQEGNDAEELHRQWGMVKEAQGWEWGPKIDRDKLLHPNLVPWDRLTEDQKRKDVLFVSVVMSLSLPALRKAENQ